MGGRVTLSRVASAWARGKCRSLGSAVREGRRTRQWQPGAPWAGPDGTCIDQRRRMNPSAGVAGEVSLQFWFDGWYDTAGLRSVGWQGLRHRHRRVAGPAATLSIVSRFSPTLVTTERSFSSMRGQP